MINVKIGAWETQGNVGSPKVTFGPKISASRVHLVTLLMVVIFSRKLET